jgi:hypothetical protein
MLWGEYGFGPRFSRPNASPPVAELIKRFKAVRFE